MLDVGRVVKPHGLRGEVVVELTTNRVERIEPGTVLASDRGDLHIVRSSPHLGRWIVVFEGVETREDADALRNVVLRAEPLDDADVLWVHELIGSDVADPDGNVLGRVESVQANPASDLLVLESGGLIPLTFLVERQPGRVVVDVPAGLLD
ncbi:MAG: rRNA processing protein RimM [Acidimicrobiaceae bacterium]|jgi:16S rRNA processing protein RimM|nr:rRNA processing protein RimM [Acidimicrobiaceae bacterium]MDQ1445607.1 rRNA processing protein RimM [Acidimicrobiaceae bacterium]